MNIQQRRPQRGGAQPFDQRILLFAVLTTSMLLLVNTTAPPPVAEKPADKAAPPKPPAAAPLAEAEVAALEEPVAEARRLALGSVDPEGDYRMLVTVTSVGAGVERLELASEDYRDLDDRSGYFGHVGYTPIEDGLRVDYVPPGTPAAEAGLAPGDVLLDTEVFEKIARSKPRRAIDFDVRRGAETLALKARLRRQPLDLFRPEIENIRLHKPDVSDEYRSAPSFLVRITAAGGRGAEDPALADANRRLTDEPWSIDEESPDGVTLRKRLASLGIDVVKRFRVVPTPEAERKNPAHPSYHFDVDVEVRNLLEGPQTVAYELTGPNGLPIEGFWYANKIGRGDGSFFGDWGSFGLRDVVVRFANDRLTQYASASVADGDVQPMGQGRPLAFAGIDSQYFASVVLPLKESLTEVRTSEVRAELATERLPLAEQDRWQNPTVVLTRDAVELAAAGQEGGTRSDGYRVFAGPKLPELLAAYAACDDPNHTLHDVLYYGWFGWAAKPMLWLLHTFYAAVGNYGLAIVLLTVVVRGAMFPISRQTALNMMKMQELKPELDRIAERYGEDMQKRAAAQQELFRKHNYNPAAGCLPMFIQLPVFMGLYRALAVDVELRQAPLFSDGIRFCSDLAAPDMLFDWSAYTPLWVDNGQGIFGFGPFFNLLPLATVGLFLVQQKLFMPEPTNDQMRLQQQMMKYMMLFMGLMFFKVPSGLCIYFIASSLWGIAERKMLPKPTPPGGASAAVGAKPLAPKPSLVKAPALPGGATRTQGAAKRSKPRKRK